MWLGQHLISPHPLSLSPSPEFLSSLQPHSSHLVPWGLELLTTHACLVLCSLLSALWTCERSLVASSPGQIREAGVISVVKPGNTKNS